IAQVVPIHQKGSPTDLVNYCLIILTTTFRKMLGICIKKLLQGQVSPLGTAQGGFRECRNALGQALCLSEDCKLLPHRNTQD
ncbi:uncharacterized protein B0P05DRAFT_462670, partial [Gilbertella persicaria]|uniref:uncharacterized protein n=1 Tax=Gilbertella persicaria TaxID=101096 RepID=UPI0022201F04